jgi:DNA-binding transcriptional MerR regulator
MQEPKDNDFLTTTPAALELGVSTQSVILYEQSGKLKAIRTSNGMRLFRREDVERFKAERAAKKRR